MDELTCVYFLATVHSFNSTCTCKFWVHSLIFTFSNTLVYFSHEWASRNLFCCSSNKFIDSHSVMGPFKPQCQIIQSIFLQPQLWREKGPWSSFHNIATPCGILWLWRDGCCCWLQSSRACWWQVACVRCFFTANSQEMMFILETV